MPRTKGSKKRTTASPDLDAQIKKLQKDKERYGQQKRNMSWLLKYWLGRRRWKRRFLQESAQGSCISGSDAIK